MRADRLRTSLIGVALAAGLSLPALALACACGCGLFDLGTQSMFPTQNGWMASLEYDFMNQDRNWSGTSPAPTLENDQRQIRTDFVTFSGSYEFHRAWSVSVEVPYWRRLLRTTAAPDLATTHDAVGDVRVRASFNGFSPDLSTGLSLGLKLPTGDFSYPAFDRDTQIGTGSTDLLLDAYQVGSFTSDGRWGWFAAGSWDQPFSSRGGYHPGPEVDATAAGFGPGWGSAAARVAPVLKLVGAVRARDGGAAADPPNTGYRRALVAPGLDARVAGLRLAVEVYLPVAQHVNGDQLLAPVLLKVHVARWF